MAQILIIDDEDLFRKSVVRMLERAGHSVTEACDGAEGIAAYRESPADLVIADILMPNKEGIETITELRQIRDDVKIIVMSGGGQIRAEYYLEVADRLGASAVIRKPFNAKDLDRAVRMCLGADG